MLSRQQRAEMLDLYKSGKSSAVLARKFGVSPSYPRVAAWEQRNRLESLARKRDDMQRRRASA